MNTSILYCYPLVGFATGSEVDAETAADIVYLKQLSRASGGSLR